METLYKIDPFYRDERGRFIPKPAILPAPLADLPAHRVIRRGAGKTTATAEAIIWSVRCVCWEGEWRVQMVKVTR